MRRIILILLSLLLANAAGASWRIYTGGFGTAWHTTGGHHGHDVDCPPDQQHDRCESSDFARANLDNSIGFRLGAEQRRSWLRRVDVVSGAELSVASTEYNISQRDFYLGSAVATAGAVTDFFHVTWGLRGGAGITASDDGHAGGTVMAEASAEVPLASGVRFRIAHRESALLLSGESLRVRDTAFLMVFAETPAAASAWRFTAGAGVSSRGLFFGEDHDLSRAPFTRLTAARRLGDRSALGITYMTSAHESTKKTVFMGYPENERGKTIDGIGIEFTSAVVTTPRYFVELGAGAELSDWADEHQLLPVDGGTEIAPVVKVSLGFPLSDRLALVATSEHLYWTGISLGESRLAVSLSSR